MEPYWKLDGKTPVPATKKEWGDMLMSSDRILCFTKIDDVEVSTIFFGLNTSPTNLDMTIPDRMFETMVFGGTFNREAWRWNTYDEAMEGHSGICLIVKADLEKKVEK